MMSHLMLLPGMISLLLMSGCLAVGATVAGVGAGVAANHQLGGINYKTFTEPLPTVEKATMVALKRMAIEIGSIDKTANGKIIKAEASDRNIEIELESLTRNTTRMRSVARKNGGIIVDSATGVEIIMQTEKALANRRV
jgi:hypothetical protein